MQSWATCGAGTNLFPGRQFSVCKARHRGGLERTVYVETAGDVSTDTIEQEIERRRTENSQEFGIVRYVQYRSRYIPP